MIEGKIALIDSDSLIFINVHCKKKVDSFGKFIIDDNGDYVKEVKTLQDCKDSVDSMIQSILFSTKSTHYLLFLTVGRNFRYDIYPEYKGNRKYGDKPAHFDAIKEYLITRWQASYFKGLEADDLVNIYKKKYNNSVICACDSDVLEGLEGKHFNYKSFKWIETSLFNANYKLWQDMIAGTHNGFPGLKGKGVKYWEKTCTELDKSKSYMEICLSEYIKHFGNEDLGIEEFYKSYKVLKIREKWEGLEFLEPIEIKDELNELQKGSIKE